MFSWTAESLCLCPAAALMVTQMPEDTSFWAGGGLVTSPAGMDEGAHPEFSLLLEFNRTHGVFSSPFCSPI